MRSLYLNVCRLCAGSCENSIPIFEETGAVNFPEKIKSYLHVDIKNANDGNDEPKMCKGCYEKIVSWDQYAEQVQKVQGMFMSFSDTDDNSKIMEKIYQGNDNENGDKPNKQSVIQESVAIDRMEKEENSHRGKKKEKSKKVKTSKAEAQKNSSDFSEEDDIPLSIQLDCSLDVLKNKLKEKEREKVKPRIKLKIKPIKKKESPESLKDDMKQNEDFQTKPTELCEKTLENDDDDDDDDNEVDLDSKDESQIKVTGLQPIFTWECLKCHTPVKNWNALVKHCKDIHNSPASVECVCGKFLQSRTSIMKHRMKHTIGYEYKCDFENCNKTFHRQQLLDVHSLSHMPKEMQPWMCCKCSRRFHSESLLKQHEKVHLPKEEKLIHPCEVCQKKFCSKSAVSAHIKAIHFGERPFVCDQCGHSFTSKGILHEHLTIHSDIYNFHCKDCNKSFKTKYRLKIHMDTHVETRYQCPICNLTLNTRRTLRMHLLVHRDDKAFQCTTCGKAFKRSKDLKNHYNLHTGRRPYTCPFCQRTFANGSNCRSHKRRMHPEELKMFEAALAAGQQPITFRAEDNTVNDKVNSSQQTDFLDDSNGSESDVSEAKCENPKFSDEDDKPVSLVPYVGECPKVENVMNGGLESVDKYKLSSPGSVPLNLQRNFKRVKDEGGDDEPEAEDEEVMKSVAMNGDENIATNITQISFVSSPQTIQFPIHTFYTFQSSGIPAFPGNPFYRQ